MERAYWIFVRIGQAFTLIYFIWWIVQLPEHQRRIWLSVLYVLLEVFAESMG